MSKSRRELESALVAYVNERLQTLDANGQSHVAHRAYELGRLAATLDTMLEEIK